MHMKDFFICGLYKKLKGAKIKHISLNFIVEFIQLLKQTLKKNLSSYRSPAKLLIEETYLLQWNIF